MRKEVQESLLETVQFLVGERLKNVNFTRSYAGLVEEIIGTDTDYGMTVEEILEHLIEELAEFSVAEIISGVGRYGLIAMTKIFEDMYECIIPHNLVHHVRVGDVVVVQNISRGSLRIVQGVISRTGDGSNILHIWDSETGEVVSTVFQLWDDVEQRAIDVIFDISEEI